jgi:prepilin-type N-terminal cleavage/methylation domain-containing protein
MNIYPKVQILKKKSAFSLIELVFVIVVLGILASLAMSRSERDLKQEAAETVLSHIRLAQQLALRDNKHRTDNNGLWQRAYWNINLTPCANGDWSYIVGSNIGLENGGANAIAKNESAVNPVDGKYLWTDNCDNLEADESESVHLSKKFGISDIAQSNACGNRQIAFDYLGRPHTDTNYDAPDFSKLMQGDCNLTFTLSTDQDGDGDIDTFNIIVKEETGHAYIEGYEDL